MIIEVIGLVVLAAFAYYLSTQRIKVEREVGEVGAKQDILRHRSSTPTAALLRLQQRWSMLSGAYAILSIGGGLIAVWTGIAQGESAARAVVDIVGDSEDAFTLAWTNFVTLGWCLFWSVHGLSLFVQTRGFSPTDGNRATLVKQLRPHLLADTAVHIIAAKLTLLSLLCELLR